MPTSTSFNLNQKGFAHLLLLLLLVAGIGIGIYLVQHPAIFKPKASENTSPDPSLCTASDTKSFGDCLFSARTNPAITRIELTKQIICSSKAECTNTGSGGGFLLSERVGDALTIFGTPGTNAGIKRINQYNYVLLGIGSNVKDVTIKDLIFDEDETANCPFTIGATHNDANCNSTIALGPNVSDVVIDNIQVLHSKGHGIGVTNVKNLTIKNSIIYDVGGEGMWFDHANQEGCEISFTSYQVCPVSDKISKNIKLENNLIANSKVSALAYAGEGTESNLSIIKGNLFTHNHHGSQYVVCPPPDPRAVPPVIGRHCGGGMFAINNSQWTVVHENIIRDGYIDAKPNDNYEPVDPTGTKTYDELGLHVTGIELGYQLKNLTIINNQIYNNSGVGIFADFSDNECQTPNCPPRDYKIQGVNILQNLLYRNLVGNLGRKVIKPNGVQDGELNLDAPGFYLGGPTYATYGNILNNPNDPNIKPIKKAYIFADPPICNSPAPGQRCKTTLRWYTNDYSNTKVIIKDNPNAVIAEGPNGSQATCADPNNTNTCWLTDAGVTFELRNASDNSLLASTRAITPFTNLTSAPSPSPSLLPINQNTPSPNPSPVLTSPQPIIGTGTISATPCTIPPRATTCSSNIVWTTSGTLDPVTVTIKEANNMLFGQGTSGQQAAPWIPKSPLTFELKIDGRVISSATVQATPLISASPNPCTLKSDGTCTSTIILNATGYTGLVIKIKEAGNVPMTGENADPIGRFEAPWISSTPLTFDLYSNGAVVDSVIVRGQH